MWPFWLAITGGASRHSGRHSGQRVQKGQPAGAWMGLGTSPVSLMRRRVRACYGSGTGAAEMSALV